MDDKQLQQKEVWTSGLAYEPYMGRWSRLVARDFLEWLNVPAGSRWLDVGCGTGALSQTILALSEERQVALRERIRSSLPFALDGSIPLVARAWAVRGIRP